MFLNAACLCSHFGISLGSSHVTEERLLVEKSRDVVRKKDAKPLVTTFCFITLLEYREEKRGSLPADPRMSSPGDVSLRHLQVHPWRITGRNQEWPARHPSGSQHRSRGWEGNGIDVSVVGVLGLQCVIILIMTAWGCTFILLLQVNHLLLWDAGGFRHCDVRHHGLITKKSPFWMQFCDVFNYLCSLRLARLLKKNP